MKLPTVRWCLCIVAAFGPAAIGVAIPPDQALDRLVVHRWTVFDGLPQSSVNAILQRADGALWLATFGGLVRFDGLTFTPVPVIGPNGDPVPRILSLLEDKGGTLWIGTEGAGLARLEGDGAATCLEGEGIENTSVGAMAEGPDGRLWIGTLSDGVYIVDAGRVNHLGVSDGLPDDDVSSICVDREGAVWIGTSNGGLAVWREGALRKVGGEGGIPDTRVAALLQLRDGRLLVGTDGGLYEGRGGRFERRRVGAGQRVDSLLEDGSGSLWVGLYRDTLVRVGRGGVESLSRVLGLPGDTLRAIYEDRDGTVWLGLNAGGLVQLRAPVFEMFGRAEGLGSDQALAVLAEPEGSLLVGLNCGPVARIRGDRVETLQSTQGPVDACGWSLLRDSRGALWIGQWEPTLDRLDPDGRLTSFGVADGLTNAVVLALIEDEEGTIWVGTHGGGVFLHRGGRFENLSTADGLVNDDVRAFLPAPDGSMWIATSGGLSHWRAGRFDNTTVDDGLPSGLTRALHLDADGNLWVGTYGGGLALRRSGLWTSFGVREGLADLTVSTVIEDRQGFFWLTGNRGVFRVSRAELLAVADGRQARVRPSRFGTEDGLRSVEFAGGFHAAGAVGSDGRLWFPTLAGVAVVDPAKLRVRPAGEVRLAAVSVDGEPVSTQAPPNAPLLLELGEEDWFEASLSTLDLVDAHRLEFQHRLIGIDSAWVDSGTDRQVRYTNLPAGRYTLRARAFHPSGGGETATDLADIVVSTVFWKAWWFPFVLLLGLAGVVWTLVKARVRVRQRREMDQLAFVHELTTGVLHELRQPLQVIQSNLDTLSLEAVEGEARAAVDEAQVSLSRLQCLLERLEEIERGKLPESTGYAASDRMTDLLGGSH